MSIQDGFAQHRPERVLSFPEVIEGLGVSRATFYRTIKLHLPVVQLSTRRFGIRESDYEAFLGERSAPSPRATQALG
jgi:predicted DNA-binding transcriptional regulator AlpA